MKTERTTLVMSRELREKIRRLAADKGISMGRFMREAIEDKVKGSRRKFRMIGIVSIDEDLGRRSGEEPAIPEPWR